MFWTRAQLKADSKQLLKLNYWPFVLVAFIFSLVTGSAFGSGSARSSVNRVRRGDFSQNIDYYFSPEFLAIVLGVIFIALVAVVGAFALSVFVLMPLQVGCTRYMVLSRKMKPEFGEMGFAFHNCYGNIVIVMLLRSIFTALWSLLLVIPGIIKSYEYRMIPYLLAEHPEMSGSDVFALSKDMMTGEKWNAFVLDLSFIGWRLLGFLFWGLPNVFWTNPYQQLTDAALYETLKPKVNL